MHEQFAMLGLQDPNLQKRIFHLFDIGRRGPWLACAWLLLGPSFWLLPKLLHPAVVKISILCRVILMDPPMAPRSVFTLVQSSLQCSSVPPVSVCRQVCRPITHNSHRLRLCAQITRTLRLRLSNVSMSTAKTKKRQKSKGNLISYKYHPQYRPNNSPRKTEFPVSRAELKEL